MGVSTICPGCGQRVQAPQGYTRRKLQCSACGVMCELPAPGEERAPANPSKSRPAPAPRAAVDQPPPRSTRKVMEDGSEEAAVHVCRVCGEKVRIATGADSKLAHCSVCGTAITVVQTDTPKRPMKRRPRPTLPPTFPPALQPKSTDLFESEETYEVRDKTKPCPNCDRALPLDALLCSGCGFNLQTGELPPAKVYRRLVRRWESGLPYRYRLRIFIACQVVFVLVCLPTLILLRELPGFFLAWLPQTAMLAFVLGTFPVVDLSRNEHGQRHLSKRWFCCFWTWDKATIDDRDYESISVTLAYDTDIWDWLILLTLLPVGIVPAVLWWYYVIRPDSVIVALCKNHGYPEFVLYRGKNEWLAREMAATLRDVTGLPLA